MKENYKYKKNIIEGGLSHIHTEASKDAILRLDEIGQYIEKHMKAEYFIITDHLTSPYKEKKYSEAEIREKVEEMIDKVQNYNNSHSKPKCISGIEVNIITDGVDVPDSLLEKIDFVIASRHFPWGNEEPNKIVNNLVSAIKNPNVDTIGHINRYIDIASINWDLIFQKAEETNTFIEINLDSPPMPKILQIMSKYNLLYTIGIDFHTFQGLKRRIPIASEIVTDFAEAKKMALSKADMAIKLRQEYFKEQIGFSVLKKLIKIMKQLETSGIDTNKIVNTLNLNNFLNLIRKPKNQRSL
jgi:histidinol phosphatase-like PHP family hydrolase